MAIIKNLGKRKYESQNEFTFNRIKRPPINAPEVQYYRVPNGRANVDLSAINPQFKYNYVYINEEESVYSPSSRVIPKPIYNFALDGERTIPFNVYESYYNSVEVIMEIDSTYEVVYKINLLYREQENSPWRLLKVFSDLGDNSVVKYIFNGGNKLIPIDQDKVNKVYDFTPEKSNDLVLSENRLFDSGVLEGKDILSDNDVDVKVSEAAYKIDMISQAPSEFKVYNTVSAVSTWSESQAGTDFNDADKFFLDRNDSGDLARLIDKDFGFAPYISGNDNYVYSRGTAAFYMDFGEMVVTKNKFNIRNINSINYLSISFTTYINVSFNVNEQGEFSRKRYVNFNLQWQRNSSLSAIENVNDLIDKLEQSTVLYHSAIDEVISDATEDQLFSMRTSSNISGSTHLLSSDDLEFTTYYETDIVSKPQGKSLRISLMSRNTYTNFWDIVVDQMRLDDDLGDNIFYTENSLNISVRISLPRLFDGQLESLTKTYSDFINGSYFAIISSGTDPQAIHWKNGIDYTFGIRYFDDYGRYSFDVSNDKMVITPTNLELISQNGVATKIKYEISSLAPSWAKYYCMTVAKREPQFEYYYTIIPTDNIANPADSLYNTYMHYKPDGSELKIKIYSNYIGDDLPNLQSPTWDFQKGDRVRIARVKSGSGVITLNGDDYSKYDYQITSIQDETFVNPSDSTQEATYTILTLNANDENELSLSNLAQEVFSDDVDIKNIVWELYRPLQDTENIAFYECTGRFEVANRLHTNGNDISGKIRLPGGQSSSGIPAVGYMEKANSWFRYKVVGKSTETNGDLLAVESKYISDHNLSWDTAFDKVGLESNEYSNQSKEYDKIRWTNTYIRDLNINGLSSNDSGDYVSLTPSHGRLRAIESFGDTIVAFQDRKVTSYYIGRKQITDTEGNTQLITTDDVISVPNQKIEDYGTIFKNSVVKNNRNIYFFDVYNKCMCMYSVNGISNISSGEDIQNPDYNFKMGKYFRDKSNEILSIGIDKVQVVSVYSEIDEILFVTFRSDSNPSINETIGFHEPSGKWVSFYSFTPELYGKYSEVFCSFKNGQLYKHNEGGTVYGEAIQSEFEFVVNQDANKKKLFDFVRLHSNKALEVEISTDKGALTRIYTGVQEEYEGQYEGVVLSNMITSSGSESLSLLYDGDRIRDYAVHVKLSGTDIELFGVDIGMTYS